MRYSRKRNKGTIIAGILSAFMLVGILVVCVVYLSNSNKDNINNDNVPTISGIDKYLVESETSADLIQSRDEVTYYINATPQINRGQSTLIIDNSQGNRYYISAILLDTVGETIYRSGIIPPGYRMVNPEVENKTIKGENQYEMIVSILHPETFEIIATKEHTVMLTTK